MKLFYILPIVVMFGFSACGELDDEFPTITLEGDKEITLKVNTFIKEPGFSANDPQDGDLSRDVNISTNLDYTRAGEYLIKYQTSDEEGNKASEIRKITIVVDGFNSGKYANYESDDSLYYLPSYLYDYHTLVSGTTINQRAYAYDLSGARLATEDKSISYQKDGDAIKRVVSGEDSNRDFITLDEIKSYSSSTLVSKYPVKMRVTNEFIDDDKSCHIVARFDNFTIQDATKVLNNNANKIYESVLQIECERRGVKDNIYYAKGLGEILRITDDKILVVEPIL